MYHYPHQQQQQQQQQQQKMRRRYCNSFLRLITNKRLVCLHGQILAMVPDQHRTSLDIILAPFTVTMDGHGVYWKELQTTKDYRALGLYFSSQDAFLEIYGTQGAVTKAFFTNH
jgi:hypothetical protein